MAYVAKDWANDELITAEDLDRIEAGLADVDTRLESAEGTVDKVKHSNVQYGDGPPAPSDAPVGAYYQDVASGDIYQQEA